MNILYVYEFYTPHVGGGEIALQHLAEGMAARGHTVHLVTSKIQGAPADEQLHGVHIHRVWVPKIASRYWFLFFSLKSIFTLAKSADLIHTFTYTAAPPAWIVAKLRRKKIILTVHEFWGDLWKSFSELNPASAKLHQWFERFLFFLPMDRWVAISHATENSLKKIGLPQEKLSVVYQGIDQKLFKRPAQTEIDVLRDELNVSPETLIYLFFGRPGISKGLEFLLRAVPEISQQLPNSKLWLILAREPQTQFKRMMKLIADLRIEQHITLLEPVKRELLPLYLASAQVVVVPSLSEGFGFSVAEACSVGTPVIASTVGSIPEVISGPHQLIPPASPTAITQALVNSSKHTFVTTPVKTFSWETTTAAYEKIYREEKP